MSAVIERIESPVADARGALDAARHDLALLDERLAAHSHDVDENDLANQRHRVAKITAVGAGLPTPKAPKLKVIDADVVPILRGRRKEIAERVAECEGRLRGACVKKLETEYARGCVEFVEAPSRANWLRVAGLHGLLGQAGISSQRLALSDSFWNFVIPLMPGVRSADPYLGEYFAASHAIAQGELGKATSAVRVAVERDIGMKLPW